MRRRDRIAIATFVLAGLSLCSSGALEAQDSSAEVESGWAGFGHNVQWKSQLDLSEKPFLRMEWKQSVGEGRAQIVGNSKFIFVASGESEKGKSKTHSVTSRLTARSIRTGAVIWEYQSESTMADEQETFGGGKATPQATPLLIEDRIVFATFTGEIICVNAKTGKEVWKRSTVEDFEAQEVQFGFSSSPTNCPQNAEHVLILAAGKKGGLVKLSVKDGGVVWGSPAKTFSYATPVYAKLDGQPQWIAITREEVLGIDADTGKRLWRFELNEAGLTNVPSPLVVDGNRILISGQGCKGTQCLEIRNSDGAWQASEAWFSESAQFFYTNWLMLNERIAIGCTDRYLTAFDCDSGEQLGRWRGFGDGNVVALGKGLIVVNGKGELSKLEVNGSASELKQTARHSIFKGRCWTAPSIIGNRIFLREDKNLICVVCEENRSQDSIKNLVGSKKPKRFVLGSPDARKPDPVQMIFAEFQSKGQASAFKLYTKLREQNELSVDQRIELAQAAYQQGIKEMATVILRDAQADFPDSKELKEKAAEWTGK